MTADSQTDIVASLRESQQVFNAAFDGISEADATRAPEAGGWSPLGIVEHTVITESSLPRWFGIGVNNPDAIRDPAREAELSVGIVNRDSKIEAPEQIHPKGRFKSVAEALHAFNTTREGTIGFAIDHESDLDTVIITHPLFGEISVRQLLILAAGHSTRHAKQIEETLGAAKT